jgi:hypothetical protein
MSQFLSQFANVADAREALGDRWSAILRWAADCAGEGAGLLGAINCESLGGPILLRALKPWGSGPYVGHWLTELRAKQLTINDNETDLALGELANVERDLVAALANPAAKGDAGVKELVAKLAARPRPSLPGAPLGQRLTFAPSADPLEQMDRAVRWLPGAEQLGLVPPPRQLTTWEEVQKAARWLKYGAVAAGLGYVVIKVAPTVARVARGG